MTALTIDILSDVVCPWCFIGARRLDQTLASLPEVEVDVAFRPFLLDPTTPPEGEDLRARLAKKYNVDPAQLFGRVEGVAREAGIPLDFSKVTRSVSTVRAHTLLVHALPKGTQRALAEALFSAYFLEGRDIGKPEVLVSIAASHGFEAAEVKALMDDEAAMTQTKEEAAAASERGIRGVPFFVFGGRLAVSGAQPVEVLRGAIEKAAATAR